jgi:hypothetical protein
MATQPSRKRKQRRRRSEERSQINFQVNKGKMEEKILF